MSFRHGIPLLLLALVAAPATAGAPDCAGREMTTRVIEIQHKPLSLAAQLVDQLVGPCGAYRVSKALGALIVEDEPSRLPPIIDAVAEWDRPPRAVRVSVSLLMASRDLPAKGGLADELRDISQTLSEMTRWTRFKALGAGSVQARERGEAVLDTAGRDRVRLRVKRVDAERKSVLNEPLDLDRPPVPRAAPRPGPRPPQRPPARVPRGHPA